LRGVFSKQNSVIRRKSNIFPPQNFFTSPNFWAGYATADHRLARQMPRGFVQCFPIIAWQSWFRGKRQFGFYLCITY